jgi:hypothetical protein
LTETAAVAGIGAWWGGSPSFRGSARPDDVHKLAVDCRWLSAHGHRLDGVLRVYTVARRWNWVIPVHVVHDRGATLQRIPDAIPLYGREVPSLPPFEALCLYGGPAIEGWLAAAGLDRVDYDEAMARPDAAEYQAYFQDRCPLFTGEAVAVLGGWHLRWDDDYYLRREMRLAQGRRTVDRDL